MTAPPPGSMCPSILCSLGPTSCLVVWASACPEGERQKSEEAEVRRGVRERRVKAGPDIHLACCLSRGLVPRISFRPSLTLRPSPHCHSQANQADQLPQGLPRRQLQDAHDRQHLARVILPRRDLLHPQVRHPYDEGEGESGRPGSPIHTSNLEAAVVLGSVHSQNSPRRSRPSALCFALSFLWWFSRAAFQQSSTQGSSFIIGFRPTHCRSATTPLSMSSWTPRP